MSLIVALTTLDNVIMASDSGTYDLGCGIRMPNGARKMFRQEVRWEDKNSLHFLTGAAGSVRQRQVMEHQFFPPFPDDIAGSGLTGYMVSQYVPALYTALHDGHALGEEDKLDGTALIAVYGTGEANNRPHVYELLSDLQMSQVSDEWNATGANYEIALGALAAMHHRGCLGTSPEEAVLGAMYVTERYSMFCRSPFHIEHLIED